MIACIVAQIAAMSLVDYATNSIARLVEREDPAVGLARLAEYPPSKGRLGFPRCLFEKPFPENEKFWLRGIDFSCVSPWNDSCGTQRAGTLISRRHIIFAKHYPPWRHCLRCSETVRIYTERAFLRCMVYVPRDPMSLW